MGIAEKGGGLHVFEADILNFFFSFLFFCQLLKLSPFFYLFVVFIFIYLFCLFIYLIFFFFATAEITAFFIFIFI